MKSPFYSYFVVTTLALSLTVGCGQSSKGSSSSAAAAPVAPAAVAPVTNAYTSTISASAGQAQADLLAWYSNTTEGLPTALGSYTEKRQITVYKAPSDSCKNKSWWIFSANICSSSSTIQSQNTVTRSVYVVSGSVKSSNANLASALNQTGMASTNVTKVQGTNGQPAFIIDYTRTDGTVLSYVVDTGLNSAYNPVVKNDSATRTTEKVTSFGF